MFGLFQGSIAYHYFMNYFSIFLKYNLLNKILIDYYLILEWA